jgi:hypothetical protein
MLKTIILTMFALSILFLAGCRTIEINECNCNQTVQPWGNNPVPQPPASR